MVTTLYDILLGLYALALLVFIGYYLSHKAPGGDASVGWALGFFTTLGLAAVVLIGWLLRPHPIPGFLVLGIPLFVLARPRLWRFGTYLYTRFPAHPDLPALQLNLENNTDGMLHIKLECWFGKKNSSAASLYTTFDFVLEAQEKRSVSLTAQQTRLLAYKAKYVTIVIFERVKEEHNGHAYERDSQPCIRYFDVKPEAFRTGSYSLACQA